MEVVQISAAAVLRQMAAILGAAVGQVAAALAVTPDTVLPLSVPGPALAEGKQGTAPKGNQQTSASSLDHRLGTALTRLQPLTAAVGEAAAMLGATAAAASPAVRPALVPSSPAQREGAPPTPAPDLPNQVSPSSSTVLPAEVAAMAPAGAKPLRGLSPPASEGLRTVLPDGHHLTEPVRAAVDALRGASEILVAVRARVEETSREQAAGAVEARDFAGTIACAEAQVALASTQFASLTSPLLWDPASRYSTRQLRRGGHGSGAEMYAASRAGSGLSSARLLVLVAILCVTGIALLLLAALDRTPVRVACAVALLAAATVFATRHLRTWRSVASAIRIGKAGEPGHEQHPT